MPSTVPASVTNRLLDALPERVRQRMLDRCERIQLGCGVVLCEPGEPMRHVYFPINGFISLIALTNRASLEVGVIGNEGMLGVSIALGVNIAPTRALVQRPVESIRMSTAAFREELKRSPVLRRELGRYTHVLLAELARRALCMCFHLLDARLARCLLMSHDRAHADHFYLTHLVLSEMLGVQRGGVTKAAGALQRKHLIHYNRGDITVIDRKGLEGASCECYQAEMAEVAQFLRGNLSSRIPGTDDGT
jgi:CRP-like cAMP-binding protein